MYNVYFISQQSTSVVVQKATDFLISRSNELALCSCYPDIAVLSGLPLTSYKRKEKFSETLNRFTTRDIGYPQLTVTDVVLSVNRPVLLNGVTVFGGAGDESYNYEVSVLKVNFLLCNIFVHHFIKIFTSNM